MANDTNSPANDRFDAMTAAPDHHTVLLENDQVRVLDTRLAPGATTPIHSHRWPAVLHVLSWSDFVRMDADGNTILDSRAMGMKQAPGSILWGPPLPPHCVRNVGGNDLHVIAIELKTSADKR